MELSSYYPYRSEAAREFCFRYLDSVAARDWRISSEARTVPTTYGPTFVRISGPSGAPPLVLLHGAGGTSLMWAPNIEALSARYRTYAVDQIGDFGRSLCTKPVRSVRDLVAWLSELFDGLDLNCCINLAGMSYGGSLAAQYAVQFPERLNKVILLAPGNTVLRVGAEFALRLILSALFRRYLPRLMRWMFADIARQDPKWIDATTELLFTNIENLQRRRTPIPGVLTDAQWGNWRVPTLFLVGEHEVIYSAEKAVQRLKRAAPTVIAEIVPGAGHDLTFVQARMVNQRIIEFLATGAPASDATARSASSSGAGC